MKIQQTVTTVTVLIAGIIIGYFLFNQPENQPGEKEIAYWVAPMDADYRRDGPGKSPMGMDLIPVYVGDEAGADDVAGFSVDPHTLASLGVKTVKAEITS